jgi:hypothetical protein
VFGSTDGPAARVILLPDESWTERGQVVASIERAGLVVLDMGSPLESKAVCAAIITSQLAPPLVIVAHGDACLVLPAIALSLRTQHRSTAGYVLVDPDAPPSTDTWPEAPVMVVSTTQEGGTSLRGWPIIASDGDVAGAVTRATISILNP